MFFIKECAIEIWDSNIAAGHFIDEMNYSMIENEDSYGYERSDNDWYKRKQIQDAFFDKFEP